MNLNMVYIFSIGFIQFVKDINIPMHPFYSCCRPPPGAVLQQSPHFRNLTWWNLRLTWIELSPQNCDSAEDLVLHLSHGLRLCPRNQGHLTFLPALFWILICCIQVSKNYHCGSRTFLFRGRATDNSRAIDSGQGTRSPRRSRSRSRSPALTTCGEQKIEWLRKACVSQYRLRTYLDHAANKHVPVGPKLRIPLSGKQL